MMNKTKALYDILARFNALKHDPRTGGELTVTTRPAPTPLVKIPDPFDRQEIITKLCETVHALQTRLTAMEQGKFTATGQPATLTVTVRGGQSQAPAPTRPQAQGVRPCPMVQPDTGSYGNAQHGSRCPLVSDYSGSW